MVFEDESKAEHLLNYVNYYKLRAYFIPFDLKTHNQSPDHKFPGTKFSDVFQLYRFDRKLRLIVCDMMERFEVAVRTQWALEISQETGDPQAHEDAGNFRPAFNHSKFMSMLQLEYDQNRATEDFVVHHKAAYPNLLTPPVWVSVELMTFGTVQYLLASTALQNVKWRVARAFDFEPRFFERYVRQASVVRNVCSHHGRLWNRELPFRPWGLETTRKPLRTSLNRNLWNQDPRAIDLIYNFLCTLSHIGSKMCDQHSWNERLVELLEEHRSLLPQMGFPTGWKAAFPI